VDCPNLVIVYSLRTGIASGQARLIEE